MSQILAARGLTVRLGGRVLFEGLDAQFEAGREEVGKGGVVRDEKVRQRVCDEVAGWFENKGWEVEGVVESPITGPEGNVEFLLAAVRY